MALALYLDENVTERLTEALVELGSDAVSANRLGNKGLNDALQLLTATQMGRVVVTYDVGDFTLLHEAWQAWSRAWNPTVTTRHGGIILLYPSKGAGVPEIAAALHHVAANIESITNRLFAWNTTDGCHEVT